MDTYLDRIVAWHRDAAAADRRDPALLEKEALESDPPRDFAAALRSATSTGADSGGTTIALIAELKRRSPSKGELAAGLDAAEVARDYESGGAACLSVLTDAPHFGGSAEDLGAARAATSLPVLRKDFTVSVRDILDARIMGADAVLLIVAALSPAELRQLHEVAGGLAMAALVEVHDEDELAVALDAGARLVGVNQRDLHTFEVDRARAARVAAAIPSGLVKVAESGVSDADDVRSLAAAGFDAVLVGEALVRAADRARATSELLGRVSPCG